MTVTVARDGAIFGEYEEAAFEAAIASGELRPTDDYWIEGMADWDAVESYRPRREPGGSKVMARTVKIEAPSREASAAPHVQIRTAAMRPPRAAWVREAAAALCIAALVPLLWKPLIAMSIALVLGALALGVITIQRGSVRAGAMLIGGCALAVLIAFACSSLAPALVG